ncbi:hypothetical protein M422DRAFT_39214 [Sphaerobolus stellatus SS14]|uniref:Uncharacterized protein n=1 Tax=Sphaerobolus stellatus (strain SS14) TaxID=990650 RepID=A0A0C9TR14_SPHS4|nr:hypothetical protein M422DRAFT_39214 [Sphaerobolus stellatus SS14]
MWSEYGLEGGSVITATLLRCHAMRPRLKIIQAHLVSATNAIQPPAYNVAVRFLDYPSDHQCFTPSPY